MYKVAREVAVMKKISHPNIIKLYEVLDNPNQEKIYLILEYAHNGNIIEWSEESQHFCLKDRKGQMEETEVRSIFRDIIKAVHYLHSNDIVHRDIKPMNILRNKKGVNKLCLTEFAKFLGDFGVSTLIENGLDIFTSNEGTMLFKSPEAVDAQGKKGYSGKPFDIWGMGISFYCFVFLQAPYVESNLKGMISSVKAADISYESNNAIISSDLIAFLSKILCKNVEKRPKIEFPFF